jgi:hypothetical protein
MPIAYNPISLGQIQTEFGGANPIALAGEYYRGAGYVTSNNTNVPTSGTIALSNFYGAYLANNPGGAILGVRPDSLGVWKYNSSSSFVIYAPGYVDLLLVGGGGSGYWGYGGAGGAGGAGGLIYIPNYYLNVGTYTINIGGSQTNSELVKDGNTILTALSGGNSGNNGGSGGQNGSALQSSQSGLSGQYGFGNNGGYSSYPGGTSWLADGGGGGAGEAGTNGSGENLGPEYGVGQQDGGPAFYSYGGKGGDGRSYDMDIDGVSRYYAGGGGGAGGSNDNATAMWGYPFGVLVFGYGGAGGLGGGGTGTGRGAGDGGSGGVWGYGSENVAGTNGTNGFGGGGGGGGPGNSNQLYHSGGSGVFIMKGSTSVLTQSYFS